MASAKALTRGGVKGTEDPWAPQPLVVGFLEFQTLDRGTERPGLDRILVQRIGEALEGTERVDVVDRRVLDAVLQLHSISEAATSPEGEPARRIELGNLLGARLLATGEIVITAEDRLTVNLRMIDTETSKVAVSVLGRSHRPRPDPVRWPTRSWTGSWPGCARSTPSGAGSWPWTTS